VSVHASLNDSTRGLIGAKQLGMMKKSAYLINTSRGPIVDGAALVEALEAGTIAGAALDVIDGEIEAAATPAQLEARKRLLAHAKASTRLILTPHIGGTTGEARRKRAVFAAQKLYERLLLAKKQEATAGR
jgi:phosphoglycerate dehydrogenase-like enzyme